jgi:hypothetical protein
VAAYCSGGDKGTFEEAFLEPPGITNSSQGEANDNSDNFAKPVLASGAVARAPPGRPVVTDKPNAEFEADTRVDQLSSATVDHASAAHCTNNALP